MNIKVNEFSLPMKKSGPYGITLGSDGAVWFTENGGNKIGKISTTGAITEYLIPPPDAGPYGITTGTDSTIWFQSLPAIKLGKLPIVERPVGNCRGVDGCLWFVEIMANKIGRITTSGEFFKYPLPSENAKPHAIVSGKEGVIWFTEWGTIRLTGLHHAER